MAIEMRIIVRSTVIAAAAAAMAACASSKPRSRSSQVSEGMR